MNKSDLALYYFHQGTNFYSYKYLGCNLEIKDGIYNYSFRAWAPNADKVELISDFSGWNNPIELVKISEQGVWEYVYTTQDSIEKHAYKFRVTRAEKSTNKGDPYARFSRGRDDGASLVFNSKFIWSDSNWLSYRKRVFGEHKKSYMAMPVNIYEVHLESYKRHEDKTPLSYRELADDLVNYCKAMGYTHIEILPIMEYPYDASWGYQVGAFFAPSSRFGDPDDFRYFVNKMHSSGIGVIMDWVPAHFPKDEWGLFEFDGCPLYEYQGKDRQESRTWGTRFFDLGRQEVQSFLISNALYYLREFHIDGLRVDAVASMLYLDYDRDEGEWVPNSLGENINLEAVAFLKKLNTAIFSEFNDALMIAEESGSLGKITTPVSDGGLGFNMKWNMGFANDFYEYLSTDPIYRRYNHKALNFPIMYAFSENYCLPISHDEVVHGKRSFIDKMYGDYEDKFKCMRSALMLFMTFPGKKLMFMGTEYAQFREWDYSSELEWFMLDYPKHRQMSEYVRSLNHFYLRRKELWEQDFTPMGFEWILADESDRNTVAYRRIGTDGSSVISVINFSGSVQKLRLPVKKCKKIIKLFETELTQLPNEILTEKVGEDYYVTLYLDRLSGVIIQESNGKKSVKIEGVDYAL